MRMPTQSIPRNHLDQALAASVGRCKRLLKDLVKRRGTRGLAGSSAATLIAKLEELAETADRLTVAVANARQRLLDLGQLEGRPLSNAEEMRYRNERNDIRREVAELARSYNRQIRAIRKWRHDGFTRSRLMDLVGLPSDDDLPPELDLQLLSQV